MAATTSDPAQSTKSPTLNKSNAAGAGGLTGGTLGLCILLYLDYHNIKLSTEEAGFVTMISATVSGWLATLLMPLITAAQQAALRKLDS